MSVCGKGGGGAFLRYKAILGRGQSGQDEMTFGVNHAPGAGSMA